MIGGVEDTENPTEFHDQLKFWICECLAVEVKLVEYYSILFG